MKRLLSTDIKQYRENSLEEDNTCALCGKEIQKEEAALDHDHKSGRVRRVLHRWCNSVLGRIENWSKRGAWDNVEFLENVVQYLKSEHTEILHPNHGRVKRRKKRATVRSGNKKRSVRKPKKTRRSVQAR